MRDQVDGGRLAVGIGDDHVGLGAEAGVGGRQPPAVAGARGAAQAGGADHDRGAERLDLHEPRLGRLEGQLSGLAAGQLLGRRGGGLAGPADGGTQRGRRLADVGDRHRGRLAAQQRADPAGRVRVAGCRGGRLGGRGQGIGAEHERGDQDDQDPGQAEAGAAQVGQLRGPQLGGAQLGRLEGRAPPRLPWVLRPAVAARRAAGREPAGPAAPPRRLRGGGVGRCRQPGGRGAGPALLVAERPAGDEGGRLSSSGPPGGAAGRSPGHTTPGQAGQAEVATGGVVDGGARGATGAPPWSSGHGGHRGRDGSASMSSHVGAGPGRSARPQVAGGPGEA